MMGQLDYKIYFRKTESGFSVDQFATFEVPNQFHERVARVIEKFRMDDKAALAHQQQRTPQQ